MNRSMDFRRHYLYAHLQSAAIMIAAVRAHRAIVRTAPGDHGAALANRMPGCFRGAS